MVTGITEDGGVGDLVRVNASGGKRWAGGEMEVVVVVV